MEISRDNLERKITDEGDFGDADPFKALFSGIFYNLVLNFGLFFVEALSLF